MGGHGRTGDGTRRKHGSAWKTGIDELAQATAAPRRLRRQGTGPELEAELLMLAQHQFVTEVKKGRLELSWDAAHHDQDSIGSLCVRGPVVPVHQQRGEYDLPAALVHVGSLLYTQGGCA